jgi:polyketide synthase Type III
MEQVIDRADVDSQTGNHRTGKLDHAGVRIIGLGTATTPFSYSQQEVLDMFRVRDPRIRSLFMNSAIERRYLTMPRPGPDGDPQPEEQGRLLAKHRVQGVEMGGQALQACLKDAGAGAAEIDYLCCVTSTGFLTPGFSAYMIDALDLSRGCGRLDVVGMGCNAGLNGLAAVTAWAAAHPGQLAVMLCVEVCSAAYVFDGTLRTSVVNSLFGDGAAAVAVMAAPAAPFASSTPALPHGPAAGPCVLRFASRIIPEAIGAMRYDWDDDAGKFSFFLDRDIPYVVGANAEAVVGDLLGGAGLLRSDVRHWIVHSGGRKVIDAVMINLGLTRHDLRHTTSVLRDYGNLSSGSFLFSYGRLLDEGAVAAGDIGVFMTMGPGSQLETALLRF